MVVLCLTKKARLILDHPIPNFLIPYTYGVTNISQIKMEQIKFGSNWYWGVKLKINSRLFKNDYNLNALYNCEQNIVDKFENNEVVNRIFMDIAAGKKYKFNLVSRSDSDYSYEYERRQLLDNIVIDKNGILLSNCTFSSKTFINFCEYGVEPLPSNSYINGFAVAIINRILNVGFDSESLPNETVKNYVKPTYKGKVFGDPKKLSVKVKVDGFIVNNSGNHTVLITLREDGLYLNYEKSFLSSW